MEELKNYPELIRRFLRFKNHKGQQFPCKAGYEWLTFKFFFAKKQIA